MFIEELRSLKKPSYHLTMEMVQTHLNYSRKPAISDILVGFAAQIMVLILDGKLEHVARP